MSKYNDFINTNSWNIKFPEINKFKYETKKDLKNLQNIAISNIYT